MKATKEYDKHHLLWPRKDWALPNAKKLRSYWYCQAIIPTKTLHDSIHCDLQRIPPPSEVMCEEALKQLCMLEDFGAIKQTDSILRRLDILICCLDNGASDTALALKRQRNLILTTRST